MARLRAITGNHEHVSAPAAEERRLARQILAFVESQIGVQVGDGECFALVETALRNAGARGAGSFARISPDSDYVWGRAVSLRALRPGDILQFRDFHLQSRVISSARNGDGASDYAQSLREEEREHHTAIVERVDGNAVVILEQNVEPQGRVVQRNRLSIANSIETTRTEDGEITTDVRVQGEIHAYRPQPALPGALAAQSPG